MIKDPFGNVVAVQQDMLRLADQMKLGDEIFDDLAKVVEKPAMMFRVHGSKTQLCYMRAIGWNRIILVSAQKKNDHFEVTGYEIDPPAKKLAELYRWADQLL